MKQVWSNCYEHYVASCSHLNNLCSIVQNYVNDRENLCCFYPLLEYLNIQNINVEDFASALFQCLFSDCEDNDVLIKKNALYFVGPSNSGKSHLSRLILDLFPITGRISQDGIFTFANAVDKSCVIWEKPTVSQEIADKAKLFLESAKNMEVTIKGQHPKKLGKRVPCIITTNNEIWKYCSSERVAFENRIYRFETFNEYPTHLLCQASEHYCYFLTGQSSGCFNSSFPRNTESNSSQRKRKASDSEETCTGHHVLRKQHIVAFVGYIIQKNFEFFKNNDYYIPVLRVLLDGGITGNNEKGFCQHSNLFDHFSIT